MISIFVFRVEIPFSVSPPCVAAGQFPNISKPPPAARKKEKEERKKEREKREEERRKREEERKKEKIGDDNLATTSERRTEPSDGSKKERENPQLKETSWFCIATSTF